MGKLNTQPGNRYSALNKLIKGEPDSPGGQTADITGKCPPAPTKTAPTTPKSSGGGGRVILGQPDSGADLISCHNGCGSNPPLNAKCPQGCTRLQYGKKNGSDTVDFNADIRIPPDYQADDTLTVQMGGSRHSGNCNVNGYKAYIGINNGKSGVDVESGAPGAKKNYDTQPAQCTGYKLKPGQRVRVRGTKENLANGIRVRVFADGVKVCELNDTSHPDFVKRQGNCTDPVDQIRIDNWPNTAKDPSPYLFGVNSTAFNG